MIPILSSSLDGNTMDVQHKSDTVEVKLEVDRKSASACPPVFAEAASTTAPNPVRYFVHTTTMRNALTGNGSSTTQNNPNLLVHAYYFVMSPPWVPTKVSHCVILKTP